MTNKVFDGLVLDDDFLVLSGLRLLRSCWSTKIVLGIKVFENKNNTNATALQKKV